MSGSSRRVPAFAKKGKAAKKVWRKTIDDHKGQTFDFTVSGWHKVSSLYESDESKITVPVDDGGSVRCLEEGCRRPDFGSFASTRSEFHFYEHVTMFHEPPKRKKPSKQSGLESFYQPLCKKAQKQTEGDSH